MLDQLINTSYLTDLYLVFNLKMESVSKNTLFGLKMMVKSGLEKIFLKFLHAGDYFLLSLVFLLIINLTNGLCLHQFFISKTTEANKSLKTDRNGAH